MKLLIDAGNTRIKWGLQDGATFKDGGAYVYRDTPLNERITDIFSSITSALDSIWISNVAGRTMHDALCNFFQDRWQKTPQFPRASRCNFGLKNGYVSSETMGMDRWFALTAAWHRLQKPLLLIGAGTCTTADMVDATGQHRGSLIAPGLRLLQESIVQRVENCQISVNLDVPAWSFGDTTGSAIHGGCTSLVHSFIEQAYHHAKKVLGNCTPLITGGDAPILLAQLSIPFEYLPALVLEGLALISA